MIVMNYEVVIKFYLKCIYCNEWSSDSCKG